MADEDPLFNLDVVRDFMLSNGGKVKNHQLVTHFKTFLNDPRRKGVNREKFKSFVNTLSSVKLDESGEKVLVLKKKYKDGASISDPSVAAATPSHKPKLAAPKRQMLDHFPLREPSVDESNDTEASSDQAKTQDNEDEKTREPEENVTEAEEVVKAAVPMDVEAADEEVIAGAGMSGDLQNNNNVKQAEERPPSPMEAEPAPKEPSPIPREPSPIRQPTPVRAPSPILPPSPAVEKRQPLQSIQSPIEDNVFASPEVESAPPVVASVPKQPALAAEAENKSSQRSSATPSESSTSSRETSVNRDVENEPLNQTAVSVKEYAKHLNKQTSRAELLSPTAPVPAKDGPASKKQRGSEGRDDDHETITLTDLELKWMITVSKGDYQEIHKLVTKNPHFAKRKDFTNGMTALHWAAKHGNEDLVKLLCGSHKVLVDSRSNGGYTPLHLAAMHGHESVIELLVQGYGADPNIRDYSGRKAKQYLRNAASTRSQQLLSARRSSSSQQGAPPPAGAAFRRVGSYSSKIRTAGHFGIQASYVVRQSWMAPGSDRSASPSPDLARRASAPLSDQQLMPPPKHAPVASVRRKRSKREPGETHSDSEMPTPPSQSPRASMVSSSDPNLAQHTTAAAYMAESCI